MTINDEIGILLEKNDLDALVVAAGNLARDRDWETLLSLRRATIHALESGRQLWPVAARIDFLLSLAAPPGEAAAAIASPYSRFAPGPLAEVAAHNHSWEEMRDLIEFPHIAASFAQERVLRGEGVDGDPLAHCEISEMPGRLLSWEPKYALATYEFDTASFPFPDLQLDTESSLDTSGAKTREQTSAKTTGAVRAADEAMRALAQVWTAQSNGRCEVVVSDTELECAFAALGPSSFRISRLKPSDALAAMAWTAASGGAYGKRPGASAGRFGALWAATAVACLQWPPDFDELGELLDDIDWYWWSTGTPHPGWRLQLAFANHSAHIFGTIEASDAA